MAAGVAKAPAAAPWAGYAELAAAVAFMAASSDGAGVVLLGPRK